MIRTAKHQVFRSGKDAQTFPPTDSTLTSRLFFSYFKQEVDFRDNLGRVTTGLTRTASRLFESKLSAVALSIQKAAAKLAIRPANLAYLFLNRRYALYATRRSPLHLIGYEFETFLHEFEVESNLIAEANYGDVERSLACSVLEELKEAHQSAKFRRFVQQYCRGHSVRFASCVSERSVWFEAALLMFANLRQRTLTYFQEHHALEILKAHTLGLLPHGDPVIIRPGHLHGEVAMHRLTTYERWVKQHSKVKERVYSYTTKSRLGTAGGFDF